MTSGLPNHPYLPATKRADATWLAFDWPDGRLLPAHPLVEEVLGYRLSPGPDHSSLEAGAIGDGLASSMRVGPIHGSGASVCSSKFWLVARADEGMVAAIGIHFRCWLNPEVQGRHPLRFAWAPVVRKDALPIPALNRLSHLSFVRLGWVRKQTLPSVIAMAIGMDYAGAASTLPDMNGRSDGSVE